MEFKFFDGTNYCTIDGATLEEAKENAQSWSSRCSNWSVFDKQEIINICKKNREILAQAKKGDEIKRDELKLIIVHPVYGCLQEIWSIKNLGNTEIKEDQYRYVGEEKCYYTGNYKCSAHTNSADVWFDI